MNRGGKTILTQSVVRVPLTAITAANGTQAAQKRIPHGHPVGRSDGAATSDLEMVRLQRVKDKEEFLKTNAELVAMNAKLLEEVASYEKRYADLLADRERLHQALASLQRKLSQVQGERDALKTTIPELIKSSFQPQKKRASLASEPPAPSALKEVTPDENPVKGTKRRFRTKKAPTLKLKEEQLLPSSSPPSQVVL